MFRNFVYTLFVFLLCSGLITCQETSVPHSAATGKSETVAPPEKSELPGNSIKSDSATFTEQKNSTTSKPEVPTTVSTKEPSPPTAKPQPKPEPSTSTHPPTPSSESTTHTSPPAPTTTPVPVTPSPPLEKGSWNVTEGNQTCIIIEGKFQIHVKYNKTEDLSINVPKLANATGNCTVGKITLLWSDNFLEFDFKKNGSEKNYYVARIHASLKLPESKANHTLKMNIDNLHDYTTPLNQSYSCGSTREIKSKNDEKLVLEEFHLQAYKLSSGHGFDESLDCSGSEGTPDIVPIIVGIVLAILVISVLVAYLISRRRSQTRGYLSM